MRRLSLFAAFVTALTAIGGCSLINAPDQVKPGGAGGAGGDAAMSSSSSTTSSSQASSSSSSSSGGMGCSTAADCKMLDDMCNAGVCINSMCEKQADPAKDNQPCDDGLFCTDMDKCQSGTCTGSPRACPPAQDPCHSAMCDEASAMCTVTPGNDGASCEDGDPCTSGDTCFAGGCLAGPATDCSGFNSGCTLGACVPMVGCQATNINEGLPCSFNDPCANNMCLSGKCTIQSAKNVGQPCNDGKFCTTGEKCDANGFCSNGLPTCVNPAVCVESICDEAAQVCNLKPILNGEACEDGNPCTGGETCLNSVCSGGIAPTIYFSESFAANNQGWVLGQEWQIGSAAASVGGAYGADPAQDHTPTADNGVAGIILGGNETPTLHPMYYLTSPAVDVTADTGKLFFTYYRWLNSDYLPFMKNVIEVFDGSAWQEVWASGGYPGVQDSPPVGTGWTFISLDITPYKNAALQVRFGYDVESGGVFTIGSWNIDDVKLQNTPCPN